MKHAKIHPWLMSCSVHGEVASSAGVHMNTKMYMLPSKND
jgi:hypothetical protein